MSADGQDTSFFDNWLNGSGNVIKSYSGYVNTTGISSYDQIPRSLSLDELLSQIEQKSTSVKPSFILLSPATMTHEDFNNHFNVKEQSSNFVKFSGLVSLKAFKTILDHYGDDAYVYKLGSGGDYFKFNVSNTPPRGTTVLHPTCPNGCAFLVEDVTKDVTGVLNTLDGFENAHFVYLTPLAAESLKTSPATASIHLVFWTFLLVTGLLICCLHSIPSPTNFTSKPLSIHKEY